MEESNTPTDSQRSSMSISSSSSSLVDISASGIVGQEQAETTAFEIFDDDNTPKAYSNKPGIRGKSKSMRMILLTQCFAG